MAGDLEADYGRDWNLCLGESSLLDIGEICFDWDIVNPWLQLWIEEFQPLITNVENQWTTEEEVLEPETCSYTSKIKQIPEKERAEYTRYYILAATKDLFIFLIPSPLLWPLFLLLPFWFFKDTSAYPHGVSINSLLFQGLQVVLINVRMKGNGGYFLQAELDRVRSWVLSRKDTKAQMEMIPHTFL